MVSYGIVTYRHKGHRWLHEKFHAPAPTQVSFVGLSNWSLDAAWLGKERRQALLSCWLPWWAAFFLTQNGWFTRENPINMDDLGVSPFMETPM